VRGVTGSKKKRSSPIRRVPREISFRESEEEIRKKEDQEGLMRENGSLIKTSVETDGGTRLEQNLRKEYEFAMSGYRGGEHKSETIWPNAQEVPGVTRRDGEG